MRAAPATYGVGAPGRRHPRAQREPELAAAPEEQRRGALGERRDGERGVHAQRGWHRRAVGHEEARMVAQLLLVVERRGGGVAALAAGPQRGGVARRTASLPSEPSGAAAP